MLELHLFHQAWNVTDINPYAMKVDAFLRMTNLEYTSKYSLNTQSAPRGQLPFLVDGDKTIGDSSVIIDYLKSTYQLDIDDSLTPTQKGVMLCTQRMLEEHMYPIILYSRMLDPNGWKVFKRDIFEKLPQFDDAAAEKLLDNIKVKLSHQGVGLHDQEAIYHFGIQNLEALVNILGDQKYFFGDKACSINAILQNILGVPIKTPLNEYLDKQLTLKCYCENFKHEFY